MLNCFINWLEQSEHKFKTSSQADIIVLHPVIKEN